MGTARKFWDNLTPEEDCACFASWEKRVLDAAAVLELTGQGLPEEEVQHKLGLFNGQAQLQTPGAISGWTPARGLPAGLPAFYEVLYTSGVAVRASPHLSAEVLRLLPQGYIAAAAGCEEETTLLPWIELLEPHGPGYILGDGREVAILGPLLRWLRPESEEGEAALQQHLARQLSVTEAWISARVRRAQPQHRLWSRLPPPDHDLPVSASLPHAVAFQAACGLVACHRQGEGGECGVLTVHGLPKGAVAEACRLAPLAGEPGKRLGKHCVALQERGWAIPLGYAALVRKPGQGSENCVATLARWAGALDSEAVLLLRATRNLLAGEELILPAGGWGEQLLEWEDSPWDVGGNPSALGKTDLTDLAGGHLYWGASQRHGAGVFAGRDLGAGRLIELCPALLLDTRGRLAAADYAMAFRPCEEGEEMVGVLPLGLGALYNHGTAGLPLADYWYDSELQLVAFVAVQDISQGQEVLIDYGDNYWENRGLRNPGR